MKPFPTMLAGPYRHLKAARTVRLKVTATIDINKEWAGNNTNEELIQQIQSRFDSSLGFRGELKDLKIKIVLH